MPGLKFSKFEASGNDFIIVEPQEEQDWAFLARALCHRQLGIGADGLLLALPSRVAIFRVRVFNADGSEAETSGNGLRCLAKYAVEAKGLKKGPVALETLAGVKQVTTFWDGNRVTSARVDMGQPRFRAEEIPLARKVAITPILDYTVPVGKRKFPLSFVSMGNPHAVHFTAEPVEGFPLAELGPRVENHPLFPQHINFEVANLVDRKHIEARVWERGVGETLSCGSGACALAVVARLKGYIDEEVEIAMPGGNLALSWDGRGEVYLSGPVREVFRGEWLR